MLGDLPDLLHPRHRPGPRLVAQVVPRLDAGEEGLEAVLLEPREVRLGEEREAALGDEVDAPGRNGLLDGVQRLVEADAEVRVVPADARPA